MPTRLKISQATLPQMICPPGKAEAFYWDADLTGFGVRALAGGKRVWFTQYRTATGRTRRESLGDLKVVKPDEARAVARSKLAAVQLGADPQGDARAARQAITTKELLDAYLNAAKTRQRDRSYVETERALMKHALPLHQLKAFEVGRREIVDLLGNIAASSGPVSANRVRAHLSAAWTWAIRAGQFDGDNPVARTPMPAAERARSRVLSDDELRLIWRSANTGRDYHRIVRLLMLTAARREEVGGMASAELTLVDDLPTAWTVPPERSKNGRELELPLTQLAVDQLPAAKKNGRLFGRDEEPFSGWSAAKTRLDAAILATMVREYTQANGRPPEEGEVQLNPWRLHDLRRTFATWANENDIEPHIVEAVLNHVSGAKGGVAGVYNHAAYRRQKRVALEAWARHIAELGKAVVAGTQQAAA